MPTPIGSLRANDVKIMVENLFPGGKDNILVQHGIQAGTCELAFDEFELRVILSGEAGNRISASIRFLQRWGKTNAQKRLYFERIVTSREELEDALAECRATVAGILQSLNSILNPPSATKTIADFFE